MTDSSESPLEAIGGLYTERHVTVQLPATLAAALVVDLDAILVELRKRHENTAQPRRIRLTDLRYRIAGEVAE